MKYLIVFIVFISMSAHAGMWELINMAHSGGYYYCTYRLSGTNMIQTITSKSYCQQYIFN